MIDYQTIFHPINQIIIKNDEQNLDNHMPWLRSHLYHANSQRQVALQAAVLQLLLVRKCAVILDIPPRKIN